MKRLLSMLLVVVMLISLSLCCVTTASAEKSGGSLSSIDIASLVSQYGKYLNSDTAAALVSAFNSVKEDGISLDTATVTAIVASLADYVGEGSNIINSDVVNTVVKAAAGAYGNDISIDKSTITAIAAGLAKNYISGLDLSDLGLDLGSIDISSIDPAVISAVIAGVSEVKENGLSLDSDTISTVVGYLAAYALNGTDFDTATIKALVNAVADVKANGLDLNSASIGKVIGSMVGNETYAQVRVIICNVTGNYPFKDIANSGYRDEILEAYYLGLVSGFAGDYYKPNQAVTRAQFITLLWRAAGEPTAAGTLKFSDKAKISSSYKTAVIWGVKNGIISGYTDNTFRPNQTITRAQMAAFMYRYMKNVEGYNFGTVKALTFTDCRNINTSYQTAIAAMVSAGIMSGVSTTKFNPNGTANRGMAAAVTVRMYNALNG